MMQHHTDYKLGVAMIDRFTYATLEYFEQNKVAEDSKNNLKELVQPHSAPSLSWGRERKLTQLSTVRR
jgi:glycosylphosphatidylinositol transamidase (GPIT) subunit GPI8